MASVGATIANRGVRMRPRVVASERGGRRRVVSRRVAAQVRDMMLGVVRGGTGTAAALPGVDVAGKTGTAELRPTHGGPIDPKNTDAWFVAFAPASDPEVAVAVMLVGAGQGGTTAAPVAREVLAAALFEVPFRLRPSRTACEGNQRFGGDHMDIGRLILRGAVGPLRRELRRRDRF